jgi:5-methylcytosine-specific restriction protein A
MPVRPCIRCGVLVESGSYCPRHQPVRRNRWNVTRGSGGQAAKFRRAVLQRAGYQCEAIENGLRCQAIEGLEAHHLIPLSKGGTDAVTNGVLLCRRHHRQIEYGCV